MQARYGWRAPRSLTRLDSEEKRDAVLQEMLVYFAEVWKIRQKEPPKFDLISLEVSIKVCR
jgi:hypothetical protein